MRDNKIYYIKERDIYYINNNYFKYREEAEKYFMEFSTLKNEETKEEKLRKIRLAKINEILK